MLEQLGQRINSSSSEDVDDPSFRSISFDELKSSYYEQVRALIEGGIDIVLIETVFDVLNAKAAIVATLEAFDNLGVEVPIIISVTFIQEGSNRTVFGQTVEAFWATIAHANPLLESTVGSVQVQWYQT